jgi:ABC-type hemin transport system ATPase subunit
MARCLPIVAFLSVECCHRNFFAAIMHLLNLAAQLNRKIIRVDAGEKIAKMALL